MDKKQSLQISNILLSVKDASAAISVSTNRRTKKEQSQARLNYALQGGGRPKVKMVRLLIASGRLKAVNLGQRMTRISLQELTAFAEQQGCLVQVSGHQPARKPLMV